MVIPNNFSMFSYNSRGFSDDKVNYSIDLLGDKANSILFIQEHFIMKKSLYKITNAFRNFSVFSIPAIKDPYSNIAGRAKGGLSMIFPKSWRKNINVVNANNWRIQAVTLKTHKNIIHLLVNVYFPCDDK